MVIVYVLAGLLGFIVIALLAAGYIAFKMSLTRVEKRPEIQKAGEEEKAKRRVRIDANKAGTEYLHGLLPEDVALQSRDGLELKGYYLPAAKPSNKLAVLVHGYTATGPREFGGFLKFYREELGFNILLPDHRCHGRSGGKYVGFAALEWQDMLDWAAAFVDRLGPDPQVVLHGISMGAATVMNCNAHNPPDYIKCVVEDCGYTNGYEMLWLAARRDLKMNIPPVMWAMAMYYRIFTGKSLRKDADPFGNIDKFKVPTLFVHGADDPFVPAEMSVRCHGAAAVEKDLLLIPGAAHSIAYFTDKETYEAKLREWYAKWVKETVAA